MDPLSSAGSAKRSPHPTTAITNTGGTGTANTYRGSTSFNGRTLAINSDANLGTAALSFSGGTLEALEARFWPIPV